MDQYQQREKWMNDLKRKMIESQLNKRIETIHEWMGEWMSGIIE